MYGKAPLLSIDPDAFGPLERLQRIHLVGVAGSGMAALADLLVAAGKTVTGSDLAYRPPAGPMLAAIGVQCLEGYAPAHLEPAPDLVVVGNAVARDNPEAQAALARGLPVTHMPALLNRLVAPSRPRVVVCGTHGKSTTATVTAWLLAQLGQDPGWFIGARPRFGPAGRLGRGPFVFEGDEYNAAFFDRGPKFAHYRPDVVLLTNVEFDHLDLYPSLRVIERTFRDWLGGLPSTARIWLTEAAARFAAAHPGSRTLTETGFGDVATDAHGVQFCWHDTTYRFPLPGHHGAEDAALALAALASLDIDPAQAGAALAQFPGLGQRQERVLDTPTMTVLRDFGHHPTEVCATLKGLRAAAPRRPLWAVFEPRSYTSRTDRLRPAYVPAFAPADRVWLGPVYRPERLRHRPLDTARLAADVGPGAHVAETWPQLAEALLAAARAHPQAPTVVIFSNGDAGGLESMLKEALCHNVPK